MIFNYPCEFIMSAVKVEQLPHHDGVEIAFLGRSNVGKSSLLNSLCNQRGLAKVSRTPGRTQQLNIFHIKERFYMVDVPGYGYAKGSKNLQAQLGHLIENYLTKRRELQRLFILIDARRGIQAIDELIMGLLDEYGVCYQLIITKSDKVGKKELLERVKKIEEDKPKHPAMMDEIIVTSSLKKNGLDSLRHCINEMEKEYGSR